MQRINESSYSFKLYSQSTTTTTDQLDFDIKYTDHINETWKLVLYINCKEEIIPFSKRSRSAAEWWDMTQRLPNDQGRLNIEILYPTERAYLPETFENNINAIFGSSLYLHVYDLYVLKYLSNEFYLTTLIIADHESYGKC